jgi:hypothetical protein
MMQNKKKIFNKDINTQNNSDEEDTERGKNLLEILIHIALKYDRIICSKHQQNCNCYVTLHGRGRL